MFSFEVVPQIVFPYLSILSLNNICSTCSNPDTSFDWNPTIQMTTSRISSLTLKYPHSISTQSFENIVFFIEYSIWVSKCFVM